MASVYRRENSRNWECAFYLPNQDGKARKVRKSTGTKNRREAERIAIELERKARDLAGIDQAHGQKIHAILNQAGEDALKERLTVAKARTYLAEILKLSTGEELTTYTVKRWADEWLERKRSQVSKATLQRYECSHRAFLSWLGEQRSQKPLEAVTTTHFRQFRDSLREGRAARTVNAYMKDVSSIFGAAVDEGLIPNNPVKPLKALPVTDSVTRSPFLPEEVNRLISKAPSEDWRGIILLGAHTGLRIGDCAGITWGNVDLSMGTLTIIPKKTQRKGVEVRIPLAAPLREFLESHPIADDPKTPVFPSLACLSVSGKKGLSMTFGRFMESTGVSRGEKHQSGMHARGFHNFRRTFISWLTNAGVAHEVREAMTGHLDSETHKLYTHHELTSLQRAIECLPGLDA
ncbi:MAG: site-specific integrase [Verrucomicrobiales bacterium]|jgi:integrase|nr:site-specific integrase [Verrucomicrobiales bacterium]MDF1788978.1 site-specific integrase [Verrucomicrobiales bacterium]MDF1863162.1 site-specific integrase [Verrucomicrobiales bacterium]